RRGKSWVNGSRAPSAHRLAGADEGAHELAIHLRRDGLGVDPGAGEKLARVLDSIDPGGLDLDALEAGAGELAPVLPFLERAGHAADPELHATPDPRGHLPPHHHVRHREVAAGTEDTEGLREHAILVR